MIEHRKRKIGTGPFLTTVTRYGWLWPPFCWSHNGGSCILRMFWRKLLYKINTHVFELRCLLVIFIYSYSKFKVTFKNADFECRYITTHTKEKPSKIFNITFVNLPLYPKKKKKKPSNWMASWVLWNLLLLMEPLDALQNGSF